MKFSVLLPTRNRLDLLSYAIESVRRQDYDNWEIIVSDNESSEDIGAYVCGLGDPRIQCSRTSSFIPVTDNWSRTLAQSNGDYVIMLGDDDCLMPAYFSRLKSLIEAHEQPDFIYTSAYLYAYPGVLPDFPNGLLRSYERCPLFRNASEPFWLSPADAVKLAEASLNFRIRFDYNMQFSLVSRRLIESLASKGPFYQSPYPDYYASNAMMLEAKRILVVPENMVAIGISPKSFGFYYFNDSEKQGTDFLQNVGDPVIAKRLEKVLLPGTNMNTSWLLSMETLASRYGVQVNYARYRLLQIVAVHVMALLGKTGAMMTLKTLRARLGFGEWCRYGIPLAIMLLLAPVTPRYFSKRLPIKLMLYSGSHPSNEYPEIEGEFNTILDVYDFANANRKSI